MAAVEEKPTTSTNSGRATETLTLSMGPQHPSTHGVLRLVLELDGETVVDCKPDIGYLHTGMEKQAETKMYYQVVPITDRMDYMSPMTNNIAYAMAVEKLLGVEVPPRAQALRVILAEASRIASHLIWLGTHGLDLGAMSMFLYCFRDREMILEAWEEMTGARMTPSFITPGGMFFDATEEFLNQMRAFAKAFPSRIDDYEAILTKNPIWLKRTQGVGVLRAEEAIQWGVTGPILRASGVNRDLRKIPPYYMGYENYDFEVPVRTEGDTFARYQCRLEEMRQSVRIIEQAVEGLPGGPVMCADKRVALPPKELVHRDMHALIYHFKIISEGFSPPAGEAYAGIEGPKGEIGFYVVSDGGPRPMRVRVRPSCFYNLQAIGDMVRGRLLADVVAIVGTLDIVLGEIDR